MDLQFYPTPQALGRRLWGKFKNQDFDRVLEPQGGDGALAEANPLNDRSMYNRRIQIDCCEIDVSKHAVLRQKGFNVVGVDFMEFANGAIYSHIIMNPPFAQGVQMVLKAWSLLWDGEIAAIVNAETIRHPFSKERQHLVRLIEQFGEVEYVEGAFAGPDSDRSSDVEVALIYLRKIADVNSDVLNDLLDGLDSDTADGKSLTQDYEARQELAVPNTVIETSVSTFNAAMKTMKESVYAEAKARYYAAMLGDTMAVRNGDQGIPSKDHTVGFVMKEISKRYADLKDRAWTSILRSSNVTSKLSSKAQKRVESEFKDIKELEFTVKNIYGFLLGIVESQGQIQIDMVLDVFDEITRYHTDNTVFYRGWKSNDRHRTCGMRIRTTRFVLPGHKSSSWRNCLDYDSMRQLADFDKVFSMLDGKSAPEVGLVDVFESQFNKLRTGSRVSGTYFDVRYYPGIGTIHFFPSNKELMDRFNRVVGKQRAWLPPSEGEVSEDFWKQYRYADKLDKELRSEALAAARMNGTRSWGWCHFQDLFRGDEGTKLRAESIIDAAAARVQERHGINIDRQIDAERQQLLLAA